MSRFWSSAVHALEHYVAGEQPKIPGLVKLNTNESPYGPSQKVLDAIQTQDLPFILGVVLITSLAVLIANLVVDVLYAVIDPRVRLS